MGCRKLFDKQGNHIGWVCSRTPAPRILHCAYCSRPHRVLCDAPKDDGKPGTCDKPCCEIHRFHVEPDTDYCWHHKALAKERLHD